MGVDNAQDVTTQGGRGRPPSKPHQTALPLALLFIFATTAAHAAENEIPRQWTDSQGRSIIGTLIHADHDHCTIRRADGTRAKVPLPILDDASQSYVREWHARHTPAADDDTIPAKADTSAPPPAPWPAKSSAGRNGEITPLAPDPENDRHRYRSKHFQIASNLDLPVSVVEDIATVFEGTLAAIKAIPLGLDPQPPDKLYRVELYDNHDNYLAAGGPKGSGGYYDPQQKRMLIALDNLGIRKAGDRLRMDHQNNAFVLKHEVTHQILHGRTPNVPVWLNEGLAEYLAAVPYSEGTCSFFRMTEQILRYVNKWRFNENPHYIPVLKPATLMRMSFSQWRFAVAGKNPYVNYNSAALLTLYFLHLDGDGKGSAIAAFLSKLRDISHPDPRYRAYEALQTQQEILLRGRTFTELQADMSQAFRNENITLVFQ